MNKLDVSKIKVVAMDLDGTLTQHKQPLTPENHAALMALKARLEQEAAASAKDPADEKSSADNHNEPNA